MTRWVNSLDELFKVIKEDMRDVLLDDVGDTVKDVERESIHDVVYSAYQPFTDARRGDDGGLSDTENMIATVYDAGKDLELWVENLTKGSQENYYITPLVRFGQDNAPYGRYQYTWNRETNDPEYLEPRDFISDAVARMERSLEHVDSMKRGLRRKGYDVR